MPPTYYNLGNVSLHVGDCLEVMRKLDESSVGSIVTDPPYGLGFMGKAWDDLPPGLPWAQECLRVLKPGGHLLAFGGSRTWHRLAVAVEDAGFEIRDSIAWLYGSGFPKSLDVSKAIDKAAGAEREVLSEGKALKRMIPGADQDRTGSWIKDNGREFIPTETAPATDDAKAWAGWGTALKPAFEPIVVGRKPLVGTVAANVLAHGTGALNIDACRVQYTDAADAAQAAVPQPTFGVKGDGQGTYNYRAGEGRNGVVHDVSKGRWPANVVLDDSQAAELDAQSGTLTSGANPKRRGADGDRTAYGEFAGQEEAFAPRGVDSGGASRFFPTFKYQAKAPTRERPKVDGVAHPTVKPLELMRWLVRLVTPPGGTVLEPFAGSGATVEACLLEGFSCIAVEREPSYVPLILDRVNRANVVLLGDLF